MLMRYTIPIAILTRVAIALATRTFFQPDEYFQALEPAHFLVFGYGDLTWEWTSNPPIRSILYPALNMPIYWLLKALHLDGTSLLVRTFSTLSTLPIIHIFTWYEDYRPENYTWPDSLWN
jgi:phosphatidylinositol glycan class B